MTSEVAEIISEIISEDKQLQATKGYQIAIDLKSLKKASMSVLVDHKQVGVYKSQDGTVISLHQDHLNNFFFYRYCEQLTNKSSLWLIAQVKNSSAVEFFNAERTLKDMFISSLSLRLIEVSRSENAINYENIWDIPLKSVPASYLPEQNSFFSLSTAKESMSTRDLFKLIKI